MSGGAAFIFILFCFFAFVGAVILGIVVIVKEIQRRSQGGFKKTGRRCPQCGKPVKDGQNFCTNCGAKME